jgi:hypothetical protein
MCPNSETSSEASGAALQSETTNRNRNAVTAVTQGDLQTAAAEKAACLPFSDASGGALDPSWTASLSRRERALLKLILAEDELPSTLARGAVIELRASGDDSRRSLLPTSTSVKVDSADAAEAQRALEAIDGEVRAIIVYNALQFLAETRQFLGVCFAKLPIGGTMIIVVPHQFLFERKLRLPSRRNPRHRRFYTPNTLLADIEEAIDPCEYRVRCLRESDADYDYKAALNSDPDGGQDILVVMEKIARPAWRPDLDQDELWTRPRDEPLRFPEAKKNEPSPIRLILPNPHGVVRLVILKLDHRGDFLMATEAFKTLRNGFPHAEITLVCGSWNVEAARRSGYFDKVVPFDFFAEDDSARTVKPSRDVLIAGFAQQMEGQSYDLAVDLRLFDDSRPVLQAIKAADRAGFDRYDSFPWLTVRLNTPSATEDDRAEERVITADRFRNSQSAHRTFEIRLESKDTQPRNRAVIWGPYQELAPGRYRIECLIEPLEDDFDVAFDVTADTGKRKLLKGTLPVRRAIYPAVVLALAERVEKFEFRILGTGKLELKPFRFLGVRLVRQGVNRGIHQSEAMTLLAHLVCLRMADPYKVELC